MTIPTGWVRGLDFSPGTTFSTPGWRGLRLNDPLSAVKELPMQTHPLNLIILLCSTAILSFTVHAADVSKASSPKIEKSFRLKVRIDVTADNDIKNSVSSYLNRELRSLGDVDIVDNDYHWALSILAVQLTTIGGYKSGVAISTVILTPFTNAVFVGLFKPEYRDGGLALTSNLFQYPDQWLNVGQTDALQNLCKEVIAQFDTKYLEEQRKSYRSFKEFLEKQK